MTGRYFPVSVHIPFGDEYLSDTELIRRINEAIAKAGHNYTLSPVDASQFVATGTPAKGDGLPATFDMTPGFHRPPKKYKNGRRARR